MKSPSPAQPGNIHTVPVLGKAIDVLEMIARSHDASTVKNLATTLGIPPTTCYRIIQSYIAKGWLRPAAKGCFELSFGLVPLLRPLLRHELLIETVRTPLSELALNTGLTAKLTVRQGADAITIHSASSPKSTAITSRVGSVVSLAIGSSGSIFLGGLADGEIRTILERAPTSAWRYQKREDVLRRVREARKVGSCFDRGSYQPHINTLSAPIHADLQEIAGAVTLLGFPTDFSPPARPELTRMLTAATRACTQAIAGHAIATAA